MSEEARYMKLNAEHMNLFEDNDKSYTIETETGSLTVSKEELYTLSELILHEVAYRDDVRNELTLRIEDGNLERDQITDELFEECVDNYIYNLESWYGSDENAEGCADAIYRAVNEVFKVSD